MPEWQISIERDRIHLGLDRRFVQEHWLVEVPDVYFNSSFNEYGDQ